MKTIKEISKPNANGKKTHKKIDIAVDYTAWIYYKNGHTKYFHRYINLIQFESGQRNILLSLPIRPLDRKADVLSKLLDYAVERYKIKQVFADQYFFDPDSIQVLQKYHLNYLIPCMEIRRIRENIKNLPTPFIVTDFQWRNVSFSLLIVEHKNKKGCFARKAYATNEEITAKNINTFEKIFSFNNTHWEIDIHSESVKYSKLTTSNLKFVHSTFSI